MFFRSYSYTRTTHGAFGLLVFISLFLRIQQDFSSYASLIFAVAWANNQFHSALDEITVYEGWKFPVGAMAENLRFTFGSSFQHRSEGFSWQRQPQLRLLSHHEWPQPRLSSPWKNLAQGNDLNVPFTISSLFMISKLPPHMCSTGKSLMLPSGNASNM